MRKRTAKSWVGALFLILLMTLVGPALKIQANEVSTTDYTVQKNDCLYKIAASKLGSGERWKEIYELNRDIIKDPSLIYIGQIFKIPASDAASESEQDASDASDEQKEADKLAQQLYDAASKEEPNITAVLESMESDKAHLEGLQYKLKSVESTSRKILTDAHDMEISVEEAAENINDSLRYTFVIEDDDYADMTKEITDTLVDSGYTVNRFKNFWILEDVSYQGINALFECKDGVIFELQFHTPDSYETKEEKTHGYYEIIRSETATEEEKAEASEKQDALFALIPVPDGVEDLSY